METRVPFQMHNIGTTKTTIKNNNKITKSSVEWKGYYDGKLADIYVSVNNNGHNEDMNIKLNNEDLMNLFGHPVIEEQIDERLIGDFFSDRPVSFINKQPQQILIPNITNTYNKNNKHYSKTINKVSKNSKTYSKSNNKNKKTQKNKKNKK